jgi:hypothetical protein
LPPIAHPLLVLQVCLPSTNTTGTGIVGAIYATMGSSVVDDGSPEATILRPDHYCFNSSCYHGNIVHVTHGFVLATPPSDDLTATWIDGRFMCAARGARESELLCR